MGAIAGLFERANVRTLDGMETAVERVMATIDELPDDVVNDEVVALYAAVDRLNARLSCALACVDPAADGAATRSGS
jgi:hypothetical protein